MDVHSEIEKCESMENPKERFVCKVNILKKVTELQRFVIEKIPALTEGEAVVKGLVRDANAIIAESAENLFNIEDIYKLGYVSEKIESLINSWNTLAYDYALVSGEEVSQFELGTRIFSPDVPPERMKKLRERILGRTP